MSAKKTPKTAKKTVKKTGKKNVKKTSKKTTKKTARQATKKTTRKAVKKAVASSEEQFTRPPRPRVAKTLARTVRKLFGVTVPGRKMCPHHDTPLDYLTASFLQQQDLLVWANRGGGKTMMAAVATLLDAIYRPGSHIRVLGGSFDQSDRLADYIRDLLIGHPTLIDGAMRRDRVRLAGGSEIRMLAQSQRAVRGQHVQKIRCDEVDLFDSDVWQAVQFATRSEADTRGSIEVLSTLHRSGGLMDKLVKQARQRKADGEFCGRPAGGYRLINWCLWEVIEKCPPSRKCSECLLQDDCRGIARQGEGFFRIDDAITIKARSSKAAWEAEMLCRGPQRQHMVFDEFDPAIHVRKVEYCADWPLFRAIDFGYASPLTCLWIQLTPDGSVHVIDEYARKRLPMTRHAAEILKKDPGPVQMTYVDPAGRQKESTSGAACTEILSSMGIPCSWRGSMIHEGLELVRAALMPAIGRPKLYIHAGCDVLIDSFNSYHYPAPGASGDPEKPVKDGPDHAIDALRYFFVNKVRPTQSIQRIKY